MRDVTPYQQRQFEFFSDPERMDKICSHVANGGSLIDLAEMFQINYSEIIAWIRRDVNNSKRYTQALEDRTEWTKDALLNELNKLILKQTEPDPTDPSKLTRAQVRDRIKAIELLGKHLSLFTEKHEVKGELTLESLVSKSYAIKD